ncbi:MAG: type II/IV secretion system ATPase subunit, partial [Candidatus Aenigmarchaeota archaeon]|nr:type II/IV secretion system ATPase subunit [Candidatus Aenigmarchaeota archaeon]
FVQATVNWDPRSKRLVYRVLEPELTPRERQQLEKLAGSLRELIDVKISSLGGGALQYLEAKVAGVLDELGMKLRGESYLKIMYYIYRDFVGLNEIEPLMHDPYIEDIGCSGVGSNIYVTHRKFGSVVTTISFPEFEQLNNFVIKLAERSGRYISYAMPLLDGTLPDGSRVQASLAKDVTTRGPTFSLRRFRKNPFSPVDLLNFRTVSSSLLAYLWLLIEHQSSLLVAGGVSAGKTTFLNMISMFIPPEKKVVSIEDVREINIPHENWIPATTRTGFGIPEAGGRRYGEVQLFDLLKESFRMKPDYVIVGEVRGKEAYVLFQGMASGNPSLGTIHAGSVEDVIKRLVTPPIELSPSLIESLDAVVIMVNAREKGASARRVKEIVEIESVDAETSHPHTTKVFAWIPAADEYKDSTDQSLLLRRISYEKGLNYRVLLEELGKRRQVVEWMQAHAVVEYDEVSAIVEQYYRDPQAVLQMARENQVPPHARGQLLEESVTGLKLAKDM